MRFYRRAGTLAFCVLFVAGCGSQSAAAPNPTTTSTSTTSTTAADPYVVPAAIDAAYVQRVLQRIEDVQADVAHDVLDSHSFTDESQSRLRAIYAGHYLAVAFEAWNDAALRGNSNLKHDPPSAVISVQKILFAGADCIWVDATPDDSKSLVTPRAPAMAQFVLKRQPHDTNINPTPFLESQATYPGRLTKAQACG